MSRGYSNHLCVYCQTARSSAQGDHIFARAFFLEDRRANLPKAPGCAACNGRKSKLETYLTAVLPFGGCHEDATDALLATSGRLEKNQRLAMELNAGMERSTIAGASALTVPVNGDDVIRYFEMVTMGLLWHHGRRYLPVDYSVVGFTPNDAAAPRIAPLLDLVGDEEQASLGNNTFRYRMTTSRGDRGITVTVYELLGGLQMADENSGEAASRLLTVTAPSRLIDRFRAVISAERNAA